MRDIIHPGNCVDQTLFPPFHEFVGCLSCSYVESLRANSSARGHREELWRTLLVHQSSCNDLL
jgi:hypothetical protein